MREFMGSCAFSDLYFRRDSLYTGGLPFRIMVVEQADGKEKIRLWMMVFFMVLGIISEIFINPNFSAADLPNVFRKAYLKILDLN